MGLSLPASMQIQPCVTVSDDFIVPSIELFALVALGKIEFKLEFGSLSTTEDSWKFCDAELKLKIMLYAKDSLRVRFLVLNVAERGQFTSSQRNHPKARKRIRNRNRTLAWKESRDICTPEPKEMKCREGQVGVWEDNERTSPAGNISGTRESLSSK